MAVEALKSTKPFQVMVVEDSAVIRSIMRRLLAEQPDIEVVAMAENGQIAIQLAKTHRPELIILDIEMPVMDGLTALPQMMKNDPNLQVIISSTLTRKNAEISLRALELGAQDYLLKPTAVSDISGTNEFTATLLSKLRNLGAVRRTALRQPLPETPALNQKQPLASQEFQSLTEQIITNTKQPIKTVAAKPFFKPKAIAIGSSTGGPQALIKLFSSLDGSIKQPIFLTQHMPATFTSVLAEHIQRQTPLKCAEAKNGEPVVGGRIYIAPGDYHMLIEKTVTGAAIRLTQDPPENYCRPAVDPMVRSLSDVYEGSVLAVILTGMGYDGAKGCQQLHQKGGQVIAQNMETSVVWGMPGAVATAGICTDVLPIGEIANKVNAIAIGGKV